MGISGCSSLTNSVTPNNATAPVKLVSNISDKATSVKIDTVVTASATDGQISGASLYWGDNPAKNLVNGAVTGGRWVASQLLEPGKTYHLLVKGLSQDGKVSSVTRTFSTQVLTLKQLTYPSVQPLQGETVGVGMPIIVRFDLPVKNRALYERKMHVVASPAAVEGSWSWISDYEVHYRPKQYWPAGSRIKVSLDVNSLPAGNGIYGQQDQNIDFNVGRSVISTVDVATHMLTVAINGKVARVIPVTTGNSTHQSREGIKIIMEKFSSVNMDAASTGVDAKDPNYYNLKGVRWAMRLTNSGEFLHAAPWSVASQGRANVSHGCTGMSTDNAAWLFSQSKRGDVVKFINSSRPIEQGNGLTDWNVSWSDYVMRSALSHS